MFDDSAAGAVRGAAFRARQPSPATAPTPARAVGLRSSDAGAATSDARPEGPKVLVVEDEPGIVDFLRRGLGEASFVVEVATDGVDGQERALSGGFDAVVLDLMLPERGGMQVLASLREARPRLPVIVLTARGEIEDRVAGLDAGAVDYLVKPFSLAELVARLRAQLRTAAQSSSTTLSAAGIEADLLTRRVFRDGRQVALSTTEFELLTYMLRNRGQVLSREQILGSVWGYEHDPATNVVDVYVGYLRRKLGRPGDPAPILTVRKVGYRLSSAS